MTTVIELHPRFCYPHVAMDGDRRFLRAVLNVRYALFWEGTYERAERECRYVASSHGFDQTEMSVHRRSHHLNW